jgi:hypothetical protein
MTRTWVVKSRPARLRDLIANAPRRCPACWARIGHRFVVVYSGTPEDPKLEGWQCGRCRTTHKAEAR